MALITFLAALLPAAPAAAQSSVSGLVVEASTGAPLERASVELVQTAAATRTDEGGRFTFGGVAVGSRLTIRARLGVLTGGTTFVFERLPESEIELPNPIRLTPRGGRHEHVTVTTAPPTTSGLRLFTPATSLEGLELLAGVPRLTDLLEGVPGVAIRSLGPGAARPIIRGFDGDRVLVTEDGVRSGDISSQAAEQGMMVDSTQADRVEVLRGPAALLYGTNVVGGVVNVVSMGSRLARDGGSGLRGRASVGVGSADAARYGGARIQAGGSRFAVWGGGNSRRTADYRSPGGTVAGTWTAMDQGEAGFVFRGERAWFSTGVRLGASDYGVPLLDEAFGEEEEEEEREEAVEVAMQRRQWRADFGFPDLDAWFDSAVFSIRTSAFLQDEIEIEEGGPPVLETRHENESLVVRGELDRSRGRFHSRAGAWANLRDFTSGGPEALAPDTRHTALAAFVLGACAAGHLAHGDEVAHGG